MIQSILSNQTLLFANTAVASIALALVGILVSRLTIRLGPEIQHHLLMTVTVLLVALPIGQTIAYANGISWFELGTAAGSDIASVNLDSNGSLSLQSVSASITPGSLVAGLVWCGIVLWMVVCIVKFGWVGWTLLRREHLSKQIGAHPTQRLQDLVQQASDQVGIDCPRCVQVSTRTCPMVVGLRQPTLVIPQDLEQELSDSQIMSILLHEMEHIRRVDNGHAIIQALAQCIYWWNPAVIILMGEIKTKREWACDDRALEQVSNTRGYAETLLTVARWVSNTNTTLAGQGLLSRRNELVQRMKRFSKCQRRWGSPTKRSIVTCLASVVLIAVPTFIPLGVFREASETESPVREVQERLVISEPQTVEVRVSYLNLDAKDKDALNAISFAIEQQTRARGSGLIVDLRQKLPERPRRFDNQLNSSCIPPRFSKESERHSVSMVLILGDSSQKAADLVRRFVSQRANVTVLEANQECEPVGVDPLEIIRTDEWCDSDVQLSQAIDILNHA